MLGNLIQVGGYVLIVTKKNSILVALKNGTEVRFEARVFTLRNLLKYIRTDL